MSDVDPSRLAAAFDEFLAMDAGERDAAMATLGVRDPALAAALADLLTRHTDLDDQVFLQPGTFDALPELSELLDADAKPRAARIGPFRLGAPVAHGGMGVVYEAWQEQPRRRVALKLLRAGLPESAARRFEHESEILARLQHPGIAQVIDAGLHTPAGLGLALPWFAMEFLEGATPLTDHARRDDLSTAQRLDLFTSVCDAVHHAHLRGVVHRDLKPANILVDHAGRVKVIDFGVASARHVEAGLQPAATLPGELVGTLQYMSPEQREGRNDEVDARSDVYSLGVVLFELLTGERPHRIDESSFVAAGIALRDTAPRRLSSVLPALRGDLETVVSAAMAHDPAQRYASADALARDVRHVAAHEPLEMNPPGAGTRLVLFARRRRALASALSVALLALLGGSAFAWHGLLRARDAEAEARDAEAEARSAQARAVEQAERAGLAESQARQDATLAQLAADDARTQRQAADRARSAAEQRAAEAEAVTVFLEELLGAPHPLMVDPDITVRESLETGAELARARFAEQSRVLARVLTAIGETVAGLGDPDAGRRHLRDVLAILRDDVADDPRAALHVLLRLVALEVDATEPRAAADWLSQARTAYDALPVEQHADGLDLDMLEAEVSVLRISGQLHQALEGAAELVARVDDTDDANSLRARNALTALASVLSDLGRYDDASDVFAEVVTRERRIWRGRNARLALALNNLGRSLYPIGKASQAEAALREGLDVLPDGMRDDHLLRGALTNNLAEALARQQRLPEAEALYRQVVGWHQSAGRLQTLDGALTLHNLAECLADQAKLSDALTEERRALEILEQVAPAGFFGTELVRSGEGWILTLLGRFGEAEDVLQVAHAGLLRALGPEDPRTHQAADRLNQVRAARQQP